CARSYGSGYYGPNFDFW
nr:immunoglobulin heavy chain junction region [Macaca mulatta]MOY24620.1 immunoglobulin heavy chain junction region [Macaca mulatta]MOY24733.1 immunoglobulin heavy chain junction region [Macaca mulatta]MOY26136.1 immunoglobulin heavy chain junction region [Macaca mulatta]MOY27021.1 immunoglobulin heavy chain junction region [Macaca mulatta]